MWDKRLIEKIEVYVGEFVLAYSFRSIADDFSLAFVGVYGPCNDTIRRSLWVELAGLLGGSCLGALGAISTSLIFMLKDREMFA
jgi:hypothetical protein